MRAVLLNRSIQSYCKLSIFCCVIIGGEIRIELKITHLLSGEYPVNTGYRMALGQENSSTRSDFYFCLIQ